MIEIKRNGDIFFAIEDICEGSKFSRQLMDHHYIILKFSTEEPVYFEIGDSVEIPGFGYYELTSAYFPKYNEETDGYDYEMQMDAYYMSWKNKICKYRPKFGANETSFKLTTTVDVHLNVILGNLKALGLKYNGKDFSVDYTTYNKDVFDIQKHFFVSYDSISIIEALNSICSEDALDCEWWIDGSIIYLGYCEMVGQVTFEQGVNMLTMSQSESKSSFITRLYAFGSDKNIPPGYFTGSDADVTTDGVATDYLMLPNKEVDKEGFFCKNGYLENVNVVKNDKQAIEGVVMFDDEYPKVSCAVSGIKTYDSTVKNDDGTNTTETFWQVTSTDSFAANFKTDWIKRNLTLMIKFESGALLGMEFVVNFKIIDNKNYFKIVANEDYGRKLPDKVMCPKIGDKFFLYNWDATKVTETNLIQEAQESLFERAKTYYNKSMIDNSNFSCVMDGKKFFNYGTFDYHPLGEQVKLISPMFADIDEKGKHYRNSRIIGIEINLDIPYDSPEYTIGEKASYSRLGQLEDKVDSITVNGLQIGGDGNGGKGVYVIGMNDSTPESDSNVYSSRRTRYSFLSKLNDDTAQGLIIFLKGLKAQDVIKAINGMSLGNGENYVNGAGNAKLADVIVDRLHDKNSTPSDRVIIGAQGFDLYMGDDGKSHLYVDYLTARTRMFASSVEIRKVSYSGGTTIFSNAGSQIAKVSYIYDAAKEKVIAYKCYAAADDGTTKTMNWWHVGMMALCQTFNVKAGELEKLENRYYWRMVVGVGQEKLDGKLYDYVILSNIKEFQGNLLTIPTYSDKTLANEQKKKLVWGNVMVEVTMDEGMQTLASLFAEQEGTDVDDNGTKIADRIFYGYDGEKPDAPAPYDVIVQVGDQIQWKKYGNVIKLSTSTEDSATDNDNAPAITMYHKLGAPHYTGSLDTNDNKIVNPYQWKIITTIISPEKVMHNTDNFQLFQGTPDNIIDPITIMYDIVPSVAYYTRHPSTQTTTPADITFSLRKRTGNKVETLTDAQIYAEYTLLDGSSNTKLLANKALSDIGNLYQITSVKLKSTIKEADHEDIVVTLDLPVLTDGVKGEQGAAGKDGINGTNGKDGEDAINIVVKDIPMVFDTEDNGLVVDGAVRYASIFVYHKKENISSQLENVAVNSTENCECEVAYNSVRNCLRAKVYKVAKEDITVDGATTQISKTAGYATIRFSYNGVMYYQQVQFVVNVSKFNSSVIQTTKKYEQKYTEVSNQVGTLNTNLNNLQDDVDSLDQQVTAIPIRSDQDLTTFESKITQTAREISLSLTEKAVSRRNLLVNSDFARNGGFALSTPSIATVERLSGYEGSNCIHTFTSSTSFPALRWEGYTAKTNNIPIVGGKKYTISCWVKVSNTNALLYVKVFGQKAITGNVETTTAATGTILDKVVPLNSANTWQLVSFTFVASGGYSYCSVRLFFRPPSTTLIDGYICRPMLEQSDSYNGWTLSEEDYNYQGGNMLDNTRYLNTGGNLTQVGMLIGNAKDGCSLSEATVQQNKSATLVRFDNVSVVANTDYVLSFFIRSKFLSSKTNVVCTLNLVTNAKFAECSSGSVSSYTSANGNSTTSGYIEFGNIPTEWTKVWYHFSPKNTYTNQAIAIQIYGRNGEGTLQVCQPKLEAGLMNTPWTEATEDVANKDALKRTGIDIEKGKITLDAENTIITGDLLLRGILVEYYEDLSANNDLFIICDMKAHKSVTVSHSRVILPMLDTHTIKDYNDKEYTVNGLKKAGVKLTIASKYNSYVAKWAQTTPSLFESYKNFDNRGLMKTYHNYASVVFADPRIADKGNYKIVSGIDTLVPTILPEGGGGYAATGYEGGVFVCNGRRGRALVLMPGQTLHLTSAIEYVNEKQVLVWYVDNSSDFTPLTKEVCFYSWDGYTYDHGFRSNGGNAFPMEVSGSSGSEYEDAVFGTKILDETNLNGSLHAYWGGFLTGYSD